MDTHNASPQFKVGDRVRVRTSYSSPHTEIGTVKEFDPAEAWAYRIEFPNGQDNDWFRPEHMQPAPPLGVEAWRLLFRAHRDGWELLSQHRNPLDNEKRRYWHHAATGQTFALETTMFR